MLLPIVLKMIIGATGLALCLSKNLERIFHMQCSQGLEVPVASRASCPLYTDIGKPAIKKLCFWATAPDKIRPC